jgi:hypothetical protein
MIDMVKFRYLNNGALEIYAIGEEILPDSTEMNGTAISLLNCGSVHIDDTWIFWEILESETVLKDGSLWVKRRKPKIPNKGKSKIILKESPLREYWKECFSRCLDCKISLKCFECGMTKDHRFLSFPIPDIDFVRRSETGIELECENFDQEILLKGDQTLAELGRKMYEGDILQCFYGEGTKKRCVFTYKNNRKGFMKYGSGI